MDILALVIQYTLVFASVLALVALGGMFAERSGVINLGLEGTMVIGALGGALTMRFLPDNTPTFAVIVLVLLASIVCGMLYSLLLAVASITFKADQTITGTALNIMATALATVVVKAITLNVDGKATPKLDYIQLQKSFIFYSNEINFAWILPVLLLIIGAILVLLAIIKFKQNKKKQKVLLCIGISSFVLFVLFSILCAFGLIDISFNWAVSLSLFIFFVLYLLNFIFNKIPLKKKIGASSIVTLIVIYLLLLASVIFNLLNRIVIKIQLNWFTVIMFVLVFVAYYVIYHTRFGLRLMSCGENPQAADSVGINVIKMRYLGVLISGFFAGIGGIAFIASVNSSWSFDVGVAGFGFLALAVMIFGQWKPLAILFGAIIFAVFRAIGLIYVEIPILKDLKIDSTWYSMLPYIVCLIVLAFTSKKSRAPKAEGIPYDKSQR